MAMESTVAPEHLRAAGTDPLTWAFVKLLGRQVSSDLVELPGLPASHWWRFTAADGSARARVVTKARCVGVVVSIQERADRVEYQIDDGTALIKAVLWNAGQTRAFALGDLVDVEGKLNMNSNWEGVHPSDHQRELRVVRITNVDDPNEEPLHWAQAMQLMTSFYTTDNNSLSRTRATQAPTRSSDDQKQGTFAHGMWERVGREAFFHLCVSAETKQLICGGEHVDQRHVVLVDVIERLLSQQKNLLKTKQRGLRVTFSELLASESTLARGSLEQPDKSNAVRDLRYVFHTLRAVGLLFLEDEETDSHELLSYELSLRPAVLAIASGRSNACTLAEIVEALVSQSRFSRVPLNWIEQGIALVVEANLISQLAGSQKYCAKHV